MALSAANGNLEVNRKVPGTRRVLFPAAAIVIAILVALALWLNLSYSSSRPFREHIRAGEAAASSRNLREAEKQWRLALKLDPSRVEPYLLLSQLYLNVDAPGEAIPLLERLQQISPKSPHVLCSLADAYTRIGNTKLGLETARNAVVIEPDCPRAHALLGIHVGDQEDTRTALAELSRARSLAPKDDNIAISYAQAQLDASDWVGAERTAREVIARNPSYATAWYTLGRAFARRDPTPDNLKTAIDSLQTSTQLNPRFGDAYAEIGRLKIASGDYKGAVAALETVWRSGLRSKETAYNLASAYRKLGDGGRAYKMDVEFKRLSDFSAEYEALQKHLSVEPDNVEVAFRLASLDISSGNLDEGRQLLDGVLQRTPRDPRALKEAITLYGRLKRPDMVKAFEERLSAVKDEQRAAGVGR